MDCFHMHAERALVVLDHCMKSYQSLEIWPRQATEVFTLVRSLCKVVSLFWTCMHVSTAPRDELNNIGQVKRTKDTSSGPGVSLHICSVLTSGVTVLAMANVFLLMVRGSCRYLCTEDLLQYRLWLLFQRFRQSFSTQTNWSKYSTIR